MNVAVSYANETARTLSPEETTEASSQPVEIRRIPSSMPRAQQYYWLSVWQRDERETLDGLEAGDYEEFDSDDPEDAARWLREAIDEDE